MQSCSDKAMRGGKMKPRCASGSVQALGQVKPSYSSEQMEDECFGLHWGLLEGSHAGQEASLSVGGLRDCCVDQGTVSFWTLNWVCCVQLSDPSESSISRREKGLKAAI